MENLSFESALRELENIVKNLESGNIDLEKSMEDYARGIKLKDFCQNKLNEASLKVEQLISNSGEIKLTEFKESY